MPRQRQALSGAPAQAAPPVAGQTYGQGVEQQQLDQALPKPNMQTAAPVSAAPAAAVQQPQPYDHAAVLAAAAPLADQTGLLQLPTNRPSEPITAGLSTGPGPGPEALAMQQGTPAGDLFRRLSQATSDPYFAELAAKARA